MPESIPPSILAHLAALKDRRRSAKVPYPLTEMVLLALAATAGADDFVDVTPWGERRLACLRRFLPHERGIPSHDTMRDVFAAIDPDLFKVCFRAWVNAAFPGGARIAKHHGHRY